MRTLARLTTHDGLLTERLDVDADDGGVLLFREVEECGEPGGMEVFRISAGEVAAVRDALDRALLAPADPRQGVML